MKRINIYLATIYQLLIATLVLGATRIFFYYFNFDLFTVPDGELWRMLLGGAIFDIAAILHFNLIFIIMRILPFNFVHNRGYMRATNIVYAICNSLAIIANLADTIFYRFTNTRTRMEALLDFLTDDNAAGIMVTHIGTYWYMIPIAAIFIGIMLLLAFIVKTRPLSRKYDRLILKIIAIPLFAGVVIIGIRSGIHSGRPLSLADAIRYTSVNNNVNLVLNTPYTIIRTIGKEVSIYKMNYMPENEAENIIRPHYCQEKYPKDSLPEFKHKNVVIIILEGIGASFYENFDKQAGAPNGGARLMPFIDSLCMDSYVCSNAYATGRRSIEGISAVLGGFPTFSPFIFMYSKYNSHTVDALPALLSGEGYNTTFYCGCNKGSYSFETFAKAMGYQRFIGRDEYGHDADYDGAWGIYDDKMAGFILNDLSSTKEPFLASWFTITSHSPYTIPEEYRALCKSPKQTMYNTVEYVNIVLRNFFREASKTKWYANTLFVITSDHGSIMDNSLYNNANTLYRVPVLFFAPDSSLARNCDKRAFSHIDITPSILGALNYNKEHISLGQNIFDDTRNHFAVLFVNNLYQIAEEDYLLQFDPITNKSVALFNKSEDPALTHNIISSEDQKRSEMELRLKAFLQEYTNRLIDDRLKVSP